MLLSIRDYFLSDRQSVFVLASVQHYYKILFCETLKNELGVGQKKNRLG